MSINRVILLGNVGKDPEIRATPSGDRIATFSLATSETWKDKTTGERKEATEWHTVVVFNQNLMGVIEQYVKKGGRVAIEGAIPRPASGRTRRAATAGPPRSWWAASMEN